MSEPVKLKPLTARENLYCHELDIDDNQTQAAIRAGFPKKSARQVASRMMTNANILAKIKEIRAKRAENIEVTAERITKELKYIGFQDINDFLDENGNFLPIEKLPERARRAIASVVRIESKNKIDLSDEKTIELFDKATIKELRKPKYNYHYKFYSKLDGLEKLGRKLGMFITKVKIEDDREEFNETDQTAEDFVTNAITEDS